MVRCTCPACGARLQVNSEATNSRIRCPACRRIFTLSETHPSEKRAQPPAAGRRRETLFDMCLKALGLGHVLREGRLLYWSWAALAAALVWAAFLLLFALAFGLRCSGLWALIATVAAATCISCARGFRAGIVSLHTSLGASRERRRNRAEAAKRATYERRLAEVARIHAVQQSRNHRQRVLRGEVFDAPVLAEEMRADMERFLKWGVNVRKATVAGKAGGVVGAGAAFYYGEPLLALLSLGAGLFSRFFAEDWKKMKVDQVRLKWFRILSRLHPEQLQQLRGEFYRVCPGATSLPDFGAPNTPTR